MEKLGFAGAYLFFLFLLQNIKTAGIRVPTIYVLSKNVKNFYFCTTLQIFVYRMMGMFLQWFHNKVFMKAKIENIIKKKLHFWACHSMCNSYMNLHYNGAHWCRGRVVDPEVLGSILSRGAFCCGLEQITAPEIMVRN